MISLPLRKPQKVFDSIGHDAVLVGRSLGQETADIRIVQIMLSGQRSQ